MWSRSSGLDCSATAVLQNTARHGTNAGQPPSRPEYPWSAGANKIRRRAQPLPVPPVEQRHYASAWEQQFDCGVRTEAAHQHQHPIKKKAEERFHQPIGAPAVQS